MLWREAMLVIELDGARAPSGAAQLAADRRRQAALEALGYRVLRFSREEVERHPAAVQRAVRAALAVSR